MITITAHPANVHLIKKEVEKRGLGVSNGWVNSIKVIQSEAVPIDEPSGKYTLPDGKVVELEDIYIHTRFVDYGPEDVEFLVYAGWVKEHRRAVFYVIDESKLDFKFRIYDQPIRCLPSPIHYVTS